VRTRGFRSRRENELRRSGRGAQCRTGNARNCGIPCRSSGAPTRGNPVPPVCTGGYNPGLLWRREGDHPRPRRWDLPETEYSRRPRSVLPCLDGGGPPHLQSTQPIPRLEMRSSLSAEPRTGTGDMFIRVYRTLLSRPGAPDRAFLGQAQGAESNSHMDRHGRGGRRAPGPGALGGCCVVGRHRQDACATLLHHRAAAASRSLPEGPGETSRPGRGGAAPCFGSCHHALTLAVVAATFHGVGPYRHESHPNRLTTGVAS